MAFYPNLQHVFHVPTQTLGSYYTIRRAYGSSDLESAQAHRQRHHIQHLSVPLESRYIECLSPESRTEQD